MTPTPYIWGGGSHGTQNPTAETERNVRSRIHCRNKEKDPLCRQGDGGWGAKSGSISSGITGERRACPLERLAAAKREGVSNGHFA